MVKKISARTWYGNPEAPHVLIVDPDLTIDKFTMSRGEYAAEAKEVVEFLNGIFCGATLAAIRTRLEDQGY
jgi:hypothetical protein